MPALNHRTAETAPETTAMPALNHRTAVTAPGPTLTPVSPPLLSPCRMVLAVVTPHEAVAQHKVVAQHEAHEQV